MRIIIMLTKNIQVTKNTAFTVVRFKAETLSVDAVRLYFKGDLVGTYVVSSLEKRSSVCLYELADETARAEAEAFVVSATTQKDLLEVLKGMKNIYRDLTENDKAIFNVYLTAFDAN